MPFIFENHERVLNILKEHSHIPVNFQKSTDVGEDMKQPVTFDEFIRILSEEDREHRLTFNKEEKKIALIFFSYNNYYNFSIFPKLLPNDGEIYSFSDALSLYKIDEYLRKEIHYFTSRIEKWIKTSLAYYLSHNHESEEYAKAECYLDPLLYNSNRTYRETLVNFHNTLHESKETFIKHHFQKRNGCVPIWVLMEELTFGQVDTFISVLDKEYRNKWLDASFGKENRVFILSWVSVIRYLRNIAAHHGRFYGKNFNVVPRIKKEDAKQYKIMQNNKNNLFVALLTLKSLISLHNSELKQEWNRFIDDFDSLITENSLIIDNDLNGFNDYWKTALVIDSIELENITE